MFTTGQVARRAGVGIETVRFYEKEGLLPKPSRKSSGYRQYTTSAIRRLAFIQTTKSLGFTLKEIRELMNLRVSGRRTCAEIKQRAELKRAAVEQKLTEITKIRDALVVLVEQCRDIGPRGECPLLEVLAESGDTHGKR